MNSDEVSNYYYFMIGVINLKFFLQDDDIINQQAALAEAKFGGLKKKSPML